MTEQEEIEEFKAKCIREREERNTYYSNRKRKENKRMIFFTICIIIIQYIYFNLIK